MILLRNVGATHRYSFRFDFMIDREDHHMHALEGMEWSNGAGQLAVPSNQCRFSDVTTTHGLLHWPLYVCPLTSVIICSGDDVKTDELDKDDVVKWIN